MATTSQPQSQDALKTESISSSAAAASGSSFDKGRPLTRLIHANAVAINFAMPIDSLKASVPPCLVVDAYKGDSFVSLVCMEMKRLPFCGLPIVPRFCELSLRCFVSERADSRRKGVLYLKSYSSSKFGSWVLGNLIPHRHQFLKIKPTNKVNGPHPPDLDYHWRVEGHENRLRIRGRDRITKRDPSSKLGFIMAHSSRYQVREGVTSAYDLTRPDWVLWDAAQANFTCDVRRLFGKEYVKPLAARPVSVFLSPGSQVTIHQPREIK